MTYAVRDQDFQSAHQVAIPTRVARGKRNYLAGIAAENQIAAAYERRGFPLVARRWRGRAGEVDLIVGDGDGLVFVEVKKSRDFASAMEALTSAQIHRIAQTATEFVASQPNGLMTDMRLDVALVNACGEFEIIENVAVD